MRAGRKYAIEPELVGLDDRPRPASTRARILLGLRQSAPFSSLQRRIIFFNLLGLAFLVVGVLYLNQFRTGLIDQRVGALRTQAEIIAITLATTAGTPEAQSGPSYDAVHANRVLRQLAEPTGVRARLYDARLRLTGDTRSLMPETQAPVPRALRDPTALERLLNRLENAYERLGTGMPADAVTYDETTRAGITQDAEVLGAVRGTISSSVRRNAQNELIVSVAVPIRQADDILGALVLSTEGGDINAIVRNERVVILQVFLMAAIVSVGLSVLLANTIARPIRRLAAAAESGGTNSARPINPERIEIPDMTSRSDEIGELSASMIRMTEALYKRIEAIESFASDVAHEIKNPLTSMRSAVETMAYAKTPEQRQRLLDIIQLDVGRMDRLVTDISNASRLDADLVRERMEPFDLGRLLDLLTGIFTQQGEARGIAVVLSLPPEGLRARGLEGRIAQVITNFVDNALSFAPPGSRITVTGTQAGTRVRVSVADQGPGVPQDNIESVFERFYTERPEGESFGTHSGLGLSISRQIIEAHGGRIWCENIPSADPDAAGPLGARFSFELPA